MNHFEYKGYLGSAEVDIESDTLVGKLLFIRDVIAYSATTPSGLRSAFEEAVDDYLAVCEEMGDEPDFPCKGTFNVRVGPQLHREIALKARTRGVSLNDFVCQALAVAVSGQSNHTVQHRHEHSVKVQVIGESEVLTATSQTPLLWQERPIGPRPTH